LVLFTGLWRIFPVFGAGFAVLVCYGWIEKEAFAPGSFPMENLPAPAIIVSFGVAAHWSPGNGVTVQQESIPGRES
jgi:hypothetical protein